VTTFVGRRRESAEVRRMLTQTRLLTVTGTAGVGKTRLASQVAGRLGRTFGDGVWLVEPASLENAALLVPTVVAALGFTDWNATAPLESLADRHLLLILDGCEHVLEECAAFVERLLSLAPDVKVLVTSREPLGIAGESVFDLRPMAGDGSQGYDEAVRLFAERAAKVAPDFTLNEHNRQVVAQLCRELDGIPLAIELAAARMRSMSVTQISERLADRFGLLTYGNRAAAPRQRTLRAAIDWSHDLCSPAERILWGRLSVFSGGFTLRAVTEVCCADVIEPANVLDLVTGLTDKSILIRNGQDGHERYELLETIRAYGRILLAESGQERMFVDRHCDHYRRLMLRAEEEWFGPEHLDRYAHLHREHANLRAALQTCLTRPGEQALRAATALTYYWILYGILSEGRRWIAEAPDHDEAPAAVRAQALLAASRLGILQNDLSAVRPLIEAAEALTGDDDPHAMELRGMVALYQGDHAAAERLLEESVTRRRSAGDHPRHWWFGLYHLASAVSAAGDARRAAEIGADALQVAEAYGALTYTSLAQWLLGLERFRRGESGAAATLIEDSLRLQRSVRCFWQTALSLEGLAWIAAADGRNRRAARILGSADALWLSLGTSALPQLAAFRDACTTRIRDALGAQTLAQELQRGAALTFDQAVAYALGERAETSAPEEPEVRLTRRENQVAELVARGWTDKEIATNLVISLRTAEGHVQHILTKLGFTSRTQIASWFTGHAHLTR
jgi:predicted ATPase/DNA-binding CsgD family transcriptional regulator